MLPARYEVQKEVRARQASQRREAEQWRLAKAVRGSQEPAAGGLLYAVTQAMSRTGVRQRLAWMRFDPGMPAR